MASTANAPQVWIQTTDPTLTGASQTGTGAGSAQAVPATGDVWIDTTSNTTRIWNGLAWVQAVLPAIALQAASGAIAVTSKTNVITKAGVAAMTLAAPTSGAGAAGQDGMLMVVTSNTAFAHTVTATGLFQCGTAAVNLATFAAFAGAGFIAVAYAGKWNIISSTAITFS